MKKGIHPRYHSKAKVICSCGNSFYIGATKPELPVEICSACHPFYTGQDKVIDAAGRVERFKKMAAKKEEFKTPKIAKVETPKTKKISREQIIRKVRIIKAR